jgi:hypothetical protein
MVFTPELASASDLDIFLDLDNPTYGFATDSWVEAPAFLSSETDDNTERLYRRQAHADAFKQLGTKVAWYRYVILGFYEFDDCSEFEGYWRQFVSKKQTFCSKVIWYNFISHVDRNIDLHPKLLAWATEIAHPHLEQLDPSFLSLDTTTITWSQIASSSTISIGDEDRSWTLVGTPKSPKGSAAKASPGSLIKPPAGSSDKKVTLPLFKLSMLRSASKAKAKKGKVPVGILKSALKPAPPVNVSNNPSETPPPPSTWKPANNPTVGVPDPPQPPVIEMDMSETQASVGTSVPSTAVTNDGTHRLTVRWKPKTNYEDLFIDQNSWLTMFLAILKSIFNDSDGSFYRWESQDMAHSLPVTELTIADLRDFVSPKITSLDTFSTFIFGLGFRYAAKKAPSEWRRNPQTQQALKDSPLTYPTPRVIVDNW